jgi:hypothetical protein
LVSQHIRSNIVGLIALFVALSGTATALQGKGTVKSKDIAKNAVTTPKLRGGAVTAPKLRDAAVTSAKLAAGAVTAADLAAGAVGTPALAPDSVTLDKIAPGVIDQGILDGAVTTEKIADEAVTTAKLDDEAVTSGQLDDEAVTTQKLDDGAVTGAKLDQPSLGLGTSAFGPMPALRVGGVIAQTAPAISETTVQWDPTNIETNNGFNVGATSVSPTVGGIYYVRLLVPWGDDPADADRMFVAQLEADGDLIQTAAARASQPVGFNYGPSTEAAGVIELDAGDQIEGVVYYSGTTPSGGIPLAGFGLTTLEAFWVGPG